jgi:CheY-like chemotaxis protein
MSRMRLPDQNGGDGTYKKVVSKFFTSHKSDTEIYHDLMHYKVREILLVATVYDAFILEREGKLTELIFGEYHQLNLSIAPRVTSVPFGEQALEMLDKHRYDMVILTMRIDEMSPFELGERIKQKSPDLPVLLLLNDDHELQLLAERDEYRSRFDRVFIWNGDAKVLLAMIKYVEDRVNVARGHPHRPRARHPPRRGLGPLLLAVPADPAHADPQADAAADLRGEPRRDPQAPAHAHAPPRCSWPRPTRRRSRPTRSSSDYMLCVISDVKFKREGELDERAGHQARRVSSRSETPSMPVLLQSSDPSYAHEAADLGVVLPQQERRRPLSRELTVLHQLQPRLRRLRLPRRLRARDRECQVDGAVPQPAADGARTSP